MIDNKYLFNKITTAPGYDSFEDNLEEAIESHEELNPLLFDKNEQLKKEVLNKLREIAQKFIEFISKADVTINITDIIIAGSNANYNYTSDSDIDLHIITNLPKSTDEMVDKLYEALYNAYRALFGKKYDISIYGIPVEVFVETNNTTLTSKGVYSILQDKWLVKPEFSEIPEIDWDAFNDEFLQ